jgi:hypothetical protein
MTAGEPRYLSQGVDYLGFLEAKLRDLRGIATLACELIQNADDVKDEQGQPGASRITFDIHEDALVVENDSDQTLIWRIFRGSFEDEAARLRLHHSWYIEVKQGESVE